MKKQKDIGWLAEMKTQQALEFLSREWDEIVVFYHSPRNGELDKLHIDFLILLRSRLSLQLQIKSAVGALKRHHKKYPHIIGIVVKKKDSPRKIADHIQRLILRLYKKAQDRRPS